MAVKKERELTCRMDGCIKDGGRVTLSRGHAEPRPPRKLLLMQLWDDELCLISGLW